MVNELIIQEKLEYAAKVYNSSNINTIYDLNISIDKSLFVEHLLTKIWGETIKYSSELKRSRNSEIEGIKLKIDSLKKNSTPGNMDELFTSLKEVANFKECLAC